MKKQVIAGLLTVGLAVASGAMELSPMFSDGMVVAENRPVRVFGTGKGRVEASFRGQTVSASVAEDGPWCVELPAGVAGGPFEMRIVLDGRVRVVRDVRVGVVLLMAGQSNMGVRLRGSSTPRLLWKGDERIRSFSTDRLEPGDPFSTTNGWVVLTSENAGKWGAIAYETAIRIAAARDVAVGIVNCFQGASTIQTWLPPEEAAKPCHQIPAGGKLHMDHTYPRYVAWNQPHGTLYRKQFRAIAPFAMSSAVWYQGESNTGRREGETYAGLLEAMMRIWRADLRESDLPFVIVQIADYVHRNDADWRRVQQAQAEVAARDPHAWLVRAADVCETNDIHPPTKSRLAARIAAVLLGRTPRGVTDGGRLYVSDSGERPRSRDLLIALGKQDAELFRDAAVQRGLSFAECETAADVAMMLEAGQTNRIFLCASGRRGGDILDLAGRMPSGVSGVVAVRPEAVGDLRSLSRPECFVMPVAIVAGKEGEQKPDGRIRELAKGISFARPDLIVYDEKAADESSVRNAFDQMLRRAEVTVPRFLDNTIRLAAVNSSAPDRAAADFICSGEHDERVFNRAVALLPLGGRIVLSDGDYYFDACNREGGSAVFLDYNEGRARVITFAGVTDSKAYNTRYGAGIHVTKKAMDAMTTNGVYRVFYGSPKRPARGEFGPYPGDFYTYTHVNNLRLENMQILFDNAAKPLRGVDGSNFGSLYMKKVYIYQESYFRDRFMHIGRPDIPIAGTVGVWSVPGSNDEAAEIRYDHVQVGGLHTGFVFDGVDHLIMEVCGACRCVQGYDFRTGAKTLSIINCADEGNTYLPRFRGKGGHVTMLDFNIERFNAAFIPVDPEPGRTEHCATEDHPGSWHGEITYTLQGGCFGFKGGSNPFWAKGHGSGVRTIDQNAK